MQCPKCQAGQLVPMELETGLVGAGCDACSGVLLPLINYRYWKQTAAATLENDNLDQHVEAEDSKEAKICPKCGKIMIKYKVGLQSENRVELCAHCDEAWLDSGEWQLLKSLELHNRLPEIFTESWQRKLRERRRLETWDRHFEKLLLTRHSNI